MAIAGVLLFHGGHLTGGYLGVDLFFVLSGFLITSLLLAEGRDRGSIGLGGFWARRARRLLPALGGLLIGVAFYCVVFAQPSELAQIRGDALATMGYVANWRQVVTGQDYWSIFRAPSPLSHTWSLAIEEQFYLVWPLVFVGLLAWWGKARIAGAVLVTAIVGAVVSTILMIALYDPLDPSRVYYGTDTRATGILLGAALAAAIAAFGTVRSRAARVAVELLGMAGVVVLAFSWTGLDGQSDRLYRGGFVVCGIATIAVIAAATHPERGPIAWALSWKPLCWLGLISYGVYLWHWPVDVVVDAQRVGLTGWPLFLVQCLVTFSIAIASYFVIEMPIRRGALPAVQWRALGPAVAATLVVLVLVTTAEARTASIAAAGDPSVRVDPSQRVLVLGDSVADTIVPGLQHAGLDARQYSNVGCRLVRGTMASKVPGVECMSGQKWGQLLNDVQPNVVFLSSGLLDLYDVKPPGQSHVLTPGTRPWARYYRGEIQTAVDILTRSGRSLVMTNIPCYGTLAGNFSQTASAYNPMRAHAANAVLAEVARRNPGRFVVLDLDRYLCPGGRFVPDLGGIHNVRPDGVHFSTDGSALVGRWLAPQLREHLRPS
jgi:peptidoglycan/LPS O-acetylase OafA/YrhL